MQENNLKGRIIAMYHTVRNFAHVMAWSERKTYAIVNGLQEPTAHEIDKMCTALNVEVPEDFRILFLR